MTRITPVLWYDMQAEEAANFYVSLLPDSRIDHVVRAPSDNPSGKEGYAMLVDFTLAGQFYATLPRGAGFWWVIADFQPEPVHDPTIAIPPGTTVVVPSIRTLQHLILNEARRRDG